MPLSLRSLSRVSNSPPTPVAMISDNELYSLAIFLGALSMLLIVLYHFLEVNSDDAAADEKPLTAASAVAPPGIAATPSKAHSGGKKGGR